ncbi:hypothetical protein Tco_0435339 [Tanacetum coccineum]
MMSSQVAKNQSQVLHVPMPLEPLNRIGEKEVNDNYKDADWDAVRRCPIKELSKIIIDRGMQNKLAKRIKVDFLDRIYKEHGSLDLEWLRNVPPEKTNKTSLFCIPRSIMILESSVTGQRITASQSTASL